MRISYWKISIYVLTFLTYAYSGYGSNVISTLRDAVIAAEAVFEDVFKNAIFVARKFKSVSEVFDAAATTDDKCTFRCPSNPDKPPLRNKFYTPSSNGCGVAGMQISTQYLPAVEMERCCNEHDLCYDTCNNDKELCDLDFRRCLFKFCDTTTYGDMGIKGCKLAANAVFATTVTLGCKAYLEAQTRSCYCPAEEKYYSKYDKRNGGGGGYGSSKYPNRDL